jgi:hypothetical protein
VLRWVFNQVSPTVTRKLWCLFVDFHAPLLTVGLNKMPDTLGINTSAGTFNRLVVAASGVIDP